MRNMIIAVAAIAACAEPQRPVRERVVYVQVPVQTPDRRAAPPRWWCAYFVNGIYSNCTTAEIDCDNFRDHQTQSPMAHCTAAAVAYCFPHKLPTGEWVEECSAVPEHCTWYLGQVREDPSRNGFALGECQEKR